MVLLAVPYLPQVNETACGAAALEMVLRFHGHQGFAQVKFHRRHHKAEPHGSGSHRIDCTDLVRVAQACGLESNIGRVYLDDLDLLRAQLRYFLAEAGTPLIACQKYTEEQPLLGHFRVLIGLEDDDTVILHDPCPRTGGPALRWPLSKVADWWQKTGENVTGGVAIWVNPQPLPADPLLWAQG